MRTCITPPSMSLGTGYDTPLMTTPVCQGLGAGHGHSRLHAGLCSSKPAPGGVFRGLTEAATAMKAEGPGRACFSPPVCASHTAQSLHPRHEQHRTRPAHLTGYPGPGQHAALHVTNMHTHRQQRRRKLECGGVSNHAQRCNLENGHLLHRAHSSHSRGRELESALGAAAASDSNWAIRDGPCGSVSRPATDTAASSQKPDWNPTCQEQEPVLFFLLAAACSFYRLTRKTSVRANSC